MKMEIKMKIKNELAWFALMFCVVTVVLLVVFYFVFPYYRIGLRYAVDGLFAVLGVRVRYPQSVMLDFMPYVSLTALILATPRKNLRPKIKIIIAASLLFFFVDIVFSILQILVSAYAKEILLVQELLVLSLPIVVWWSFAGSIFTSGKEDDVEQNVEQNVK